MQIFLLLVIGLLAGALGGLLGIGGAVLMIPALMYIFKMSQHMAQGTALGAMLLPVGLLAAIKYYQAGNLNVGFAALIAVGFLIGGFFGASLAMPIPDEILRKIFGAFLLLVALQMIIWG
jgi:uncharacterized membrane protein YfcA